MSAKVRQEKGLQSFLDDQRTRKTCSSCSFFLNIVVVQSYGWYRNEQHQPKMAKQVFVFPLPAFSPFVIMSCIRNGWKEEKSLLLAVDKNRSFVIAFVCSAHTITNRHMITFLGSRAEFKPTMINSLFVSRYRAKRGRRRNERSFCQSRHIPGS